MSEIEHTAYEIVGVSSDEDYQLKPNEISASFSKYQELYETLTSSKVSTHARLYERHDQKAIDGQGLYKKAANSAILAVFLISAIAVVLMVLSIFLGDYDEARASSCWKLPSILLSGCLLVLSIWAAINVNRIRTGNLLEKWMQNRAKAESHRQSYFYEMWHETDGDVSVKVKALQFEIFRRYQFDLQQTFYEERSKDHGASAKGLSIISEIALVLGGIAAAGGTLGVSLGYTNAVMISAMAAFASALTAYVSNRESIHQYRRTAERYENVNSDLIELGKHFDEVRAKIKQGNNVPCSKLIIAVHDLLSAEHKQWLGDGNLRSSAMDDFEKSLNETK